MLGLIVVAIIAVYALVVLGLVVGGFKLHRFPGAVIALVVGLIPIWDWIIGSAILKVACSTDPPRTVIYESVVDWKARHVDQMAEIRFPPEHRSLRHQKPESRREWYPLTDFNRKVRSEERLRGFGILPSWPVIRVESRLVDFSENKVLASQHGYILKTFVSTLWSKAVAPSGGGTCPYEPDRVSTAPRYERELSAYISELLR